MKIYILIATASLAIFGCNDSSEPNTNEEAAIEESASMPETLVRDFDESEMDKAISKSKSTVDEFISALNRKDAESYSVKVPIVDGENAEHFWVVDVEYKDGEFVGKIGNDPGIVSNVKYGDVRSVKKEDISDWMYVKGEKIYGGYTIDPLLKTMSKEEAEAMRSRLVR